MLNASTAVWSDSDPLYFTYNTVLSLGDVTRPITSLFYNHGRILAFHREGAYALYLSEDSDTVEFYPILQGMGCSARDTTLYLETDPVVVNRGGVFRLHSMASAPDLFEITCLSEGIDALCGDEFATEAVVCEDTLHGELWFCNPQEKLVWVYRTASEEWTVFDNLSPVFFFRVGTDVGFATPCAVCLFDELLSTDNGLPINAFYRTGYLSFGYPELPKRSFRISLAAHTGGNRFDLEIDGESGHRDFSIQGTPKSFPELLDRRLTLGRSRLMQVTLRDSGSERSRIYRLALYANL